MNMMQNQVRQQKTIVARLLQVRKTVPTNDEGGLSHMPFWEVLERRDLLLCAASFAATFQRVTWGERTGVYCLYCRDSKCAANECQVMMRDLRSDGEEKGVWRYCLTW